jgi:hypothetical protein
LEPWRAVCLSLIWLYTYVVIYCLVCSTHYCVSGICELVGGSNLNSSSLFVSNPLLSSTRTPS